MPRRLKKRDWLAETTLSLTDNVCQICLAEFIDLDDCKKHIKQTHVSESCRNRYCELCAVLCSDYESFAMHIIYNHLPSMKECFFCHRVFFKESEYEEHIAGHKKDKDRFSCSECESKFNLVQQLSDHEYENHKYPETGVWLRHMYDVLSSVLNTRVDNIKSLTSKVLTCTACCFTGPQNSYVKHLMKKNCISLTCSHCCTVFSRKTALAEHFRLSAKCMRADMQVTRCNNCNQLFTFESIKNHKCMELNCTMCKEKFNNIDDYTFHQSHCHENSIILMKCKYCTKEFVGPAGLDKHLQRAHQNRELYKYQCLDCDVFFEHPQKLFAHFAVQHRGLEPFNCTLCDVKFKTRKKFTIHIKMKHKDEGTVKFDDKFHVFYILKKPDIGTQESNIKTDIKTKQGNKKATQTATKITNEPNKETDTKSSEMDENFTAESLETEYIDTEMLDPDFDNEEYAKNVNLSTSIPDKTNKIDKVKKPNSNKLNIKCKARKSIRQPTSDATDVEYLSTDEEDLPLNILVERSQSKQKKTINLDSPQPKISKKQMKFTCNICFKYCYTYQNYQYHISLHNSDTMRCLKCAKIFKNKDKLERHIAKKHSSSQLTEKLKEILLRRKLEQKKLAKLKQKTKENLNLEKAKKIELKKAKKPEKKPEPKKIPIHEIIKRTIKKVPIKPSDCMATIKKLDFSVQDFLENFTPVARAKREMSVAQSIIMRPVEVTTPRKPLIKMTKFTAREEPVGKVKLAMPVKAKVDSIMGQMNIRVDIIRNVPEPAQEVLLDNDVPNDEFEEQQNKITPPDDANVIVLPPNYQLPGTEVRIARLQKEYPYYNIVKLSELQNNVEVKKETEVVKKSTPKKQVTMPDGTRLVAVNPLAHLLDRPIEELFEKEEEKYYKRKEHDMEEVVAKALMADSGPRYRKKKNIKSE